MVFPGANFGEDRPGRMEEMTVPLDVRNDIRSMDARGVPRAEIAREPHLSRNTVARYADMEDLSPAASMSGRSPVVAVPGFLMSASKDWKNAAEGTGTRSRQEP